MLLARTSSIVVAPAQTAPCVMDDAFIVDSGTDATDALRLYLRPLLGSGMPDVFRLRPAPVARVLKP